MSPTGVVPILMQNKDIEPVFFIPRHKHLDAITTKLEVHSCVLNVANAIQAYSRVAFAKKDRFYLNTTILRVRCVHAKVYLSDVVHKAAYREHVESTKGTFLLTVRIR